MTAEEQRDRWLKRILPGLAVGVVYAVLIGPVVGGKADKAQQEHLALMSKGIAVEALPGMQQQLDGLEKEIVMLKQRDGKIQAELGGYAGFLTKPGAKNGTGEKLAQLLVDHQLRVIEEKYEEKPALESYPKTVRDLREWLQSALDLKQGMTVLEIHFAGRYTDTYAALAELAEGKVDALPVTLTMQEWQEGKGQGLLEWRLKLWI